MQSLRGETYRNIAVWIQLNTDLNLKQWQYHILIMMNDHRNGDEIQPSANQTLGQKDLMCALIFYVNLMFYES